MSTLFELIQGAGLVPMDAGNVTLPNYQFPVIQVADKGFSESPQPLMCRDAPSVTPDATVLYFTLPGCENCRPGLNALRRLATKEAALADSKLCFRVVVSDWQTRAEIEQELTQLSWQGNVGVVWDAEGILQERLAVMAQPAFFLLDGKGVLVAYQSGAVDFYAPGFEVFWTKFSDLIKNRAENSIRDISWASNLHEDQLMKSSSTVMFLNNGALSLLWLVAIGAVCYSLVRFFLRLRKNFRGS